MAEKMDVEETPQATAEKEEASDEVVPKDEGDSKAQAAKMDVEETPQATAEKEEASDEVVSKDEGDSKAEAASPAAKVAARPKVEYRNKEGEELIIDSVKPSELLYFIKCKRCKITVKNQAAKCIVDSCEDVQLDLEQSLISGTLELLDCEKVLVTVSPEHPLPTVQADDCNKMELHYQQPSDFGSLYSFQCADVSVHFQPPHKEKTELDLECDFEQYVTKYENDEFVTAEVVRESGGYPTTEKEIGRRIAPKKDMRSIFESYLRNLFTFNIDEEALKAAQEADTRTEEEKKAAAKELLASLFSSNIKDEEEKKEIFDTPEEFSEKVDRVAGWMKECNYIIIFTGAGISTSSGIPDYRSGMNTVLKTGPGVWELAANQTDRPEGSSVTPIINALPSPTHMSIVQLQKLGLIKYTVSQNIDGLHRRSGLPPSHLSELHGNTNLETCKECKRQYLRDFETRESKFVFDHTTSRHCADKSCGGVLSDSIINFGEPLPQEEISNAFKHSRAADLCIVLGSSLRVSPANQVPLNVQENGGKVVICNLQKISSYTPDERTMQVFAKCDDFIEALCKRMEVEIPPFVLYRRARVATSQESEGSEIKVAVTGLDVDEDLPYSFIKTAAARYGEHQLETSEEPLVLTLPTGVDAPLPSIIVQCQGHYGEPTFQLECPPVGQAQSYRMCYEVLAGKNWVVTKEDSN